MDSFIQSDGHLFKEEKEDSPPGEDGSEGESDGDLEFQDSYDDLLVS